MTIRRRLARSNLVMIPIPVAIAAVLLLLGGGLALLLLERVWLPRLGLSFAALHETGEQLETAFAGAKALAAIYAGTVILALLATVAFTNFYLTRSLFRHISAPLQTLVAGVERIRGGNLESPIGYTAEDEFKPACDAVDAMAARLKASLDARQIFKNGVELPLKNREYELLLFLIRHPGQVSSREDLYEMIWGLESMGDNITVAVHIGRIREKLEDDPASPKLLQTVWGIGYRLRTDAV